MPALMDDAIRAGAYRKRITIQQKATVSHTGLGTPQTVEKPVVKSWAKISRLHGQNFVMTGQVVGDASDFVEMRYQPGIEEGMQVVYSPALGKPRTLDINAVIDFDERHVKLYLFCTEAGK